MPTLLRAESDAHLASRTARVTAGTAADAPPRLLVGDSAATALMEWGSHSTDHPLAAIGSNGGLEAGCRRAAAELEAHLVAPGLEWLEEQGDRMARAAHDLAQMVGMDGTERPPPRPSHSAAARRVRTARSGGGGGAGGRLRGGLDDPLLEALRLHMGIRRELATRLSRILVLPPPAAREDATRPPSIEERRVFADVAPFVPYRLMLLQQVRPSHLGSAREYAAFAERQCASLVVGLLAAIRRAPAGHIWQVQVVEATEEQQQQQEEKDTDDAPSATSANSQTATAASAVARTASLDAPSAERLLLRMTRGELLPLLHAHTAAALAVSAAAGAAQASAHGSTGERTAAAVEGAVIAAPPAAVDVSDPTCADGSAAREPKNDDDSVVSHAHPPPPSPPSSPPPPPSPPPLPPPPLLGRRRRLTSSATPPRLHASRRLAVASSTARLRRLLRLSACRLFRLPPAASAAAPPPAARGAPPASRPRLLPASRRLLLPRPPPGATQPPLELVAEPTPVWPPSVAPRSLSYHTHLLCMLQRCLRAWMHSMEPAHGARPAATRCGSASPRLCAPMQFDSTSTFAACTPRVGGCTTPRGRGGYAVGRGRTERPRQRAAVHGALLHGLLCDYHSYFNADRRPLAVLREVTAVSRLELLLLCLLWSCPPQPTLRASSSSPSPITRGPPSTLRRPP